MKNCFQFGSYIPEVELLDKLVLRLNNNPSYRHTTFCLSTYALVNNSNCFYFLAIVNKVSVNMSCQISQVSAFSSVEYIPRTGTVGSLSNSIFSFFEELCAFFHSSCTLVNFDQKCTRVPISPNPCQQLLFCCF